MARIAIGAVLASFLLTAGPAGATGSPCQVVDGYFSHVWGGRVQNAFVSRANPLLSWTVEDGGRLRATRDGGATWAFQPTPPCAQGQLAGVFFLTASPRQGWAVGEGGVVLHTTNAGLTWDSLPTQLDASGQPAELWAVRFLDPLVGWIAGKHLLRATTDGGLSWSDVTVVHPGVPGFTLADVELYALSLLALGSHYTLLASAEPGLVLRSDDASAGAAWTVVYDTCLAPPLCSACAPANPCTATPRLELWDVELVPGASSLGQAEAVAAGGFANQCGVLLASHDGGLTWSQEHPVDDPCNAGTCPGSGAQPVLPTQYATTAFADHTALAVGYAGTILKRDPTCSPAVWRPEPQIPGPHGPFSQPLVGVDGNGVGGGAGTARITGLFNGIFGSTAGGATGSWHVETTGNDLLRFGAIHFASATDGWAAGQSYRISKTTDGGVNWTDQTPTLGNGKIASLRFTTGALSGVAVGGTYDTVSPKILWTADGGANWQDPTTIAAGAGNRFLNAVTWTSGSQFWAVGLSGTVLYSSDGGADWSAVPIVLGGLPVTDAKLQGVAFADPNTGLVVGSQGGQGRIYRVANATDPLTRTWTELSPPASAGVIELRSAAVFGSRAYVVGRKATATGETGTIYRFSGTAFVEETALPPIPPCTPVAADAGEWNQVAFSPAGTRVFVGGGCGHFLRFDGAAWLELKSHTSSDIDSLSFFADTGGFVHAIGMGNGSIVRYAGN